MIVLAKTRCAAAMLYAILCYDREDGAGAYEIRAADVYRPGPLAVRRALSLDA